MLNPTHSKRLVKIAHVLMSHGFHDMVTAMSKSKIAANLKGLSDSEVSALEKGSESKESRIRQVLEELGTTFIKLGQILSTRPDLIPPGYAQEFKKLQSDTPKAPYKEIYQRLETSFPGELDALFQHIDEKPLASASIAQVHRATLIDGTPVVLKILKPGAEEIVNGDIAILQELAKLFSSQKEKLGFDPVEVVEEFATTMASELDFVKEARATDRLSEQFAADEGVSFPKVYWDTTSSTVLTLEEVVGLPLSKIDLETLSPEAKTRACENGTNAVFTMCLETGFFHADPHPGNLFVQPDGGITFIDCGMTGRVDSKTRFQLLQLVKEVIDGDLDSTIRVAIDLTKADPSLEKNRPFRRDVWEIISHFHTESLAGLDIVEFLDRFFEALRKHKVTCPADIVYLIKSLVTIEGVAEMLDPEFDLVGETKPLLNRLIREHYGIHAIKARLITTMSSYVDLIEEFPEEIRDLVIRFHRNGFAVNLKVESLEELRSSLLRVGRIVSMAMILSAMLISSAVLVHSESNMEEKGTFTALGTTIFSVCCIFVLYLGIRSFGKNK